jgi:hypothetical protein
VVGDAEGGRADHLEIVGAVACGDGLFERGARLMAEDLERAALAVGVEDAAARGARHGAREDAAFGVDAEHVAEVARHAAVDHRFDARVAGIVVVDEPLAVLDAQQALFRHVAADADDDFVEEVQRLLDDRFVAAREGIERSRENGCFHPSLWVYCRQRYE